MLVVLSGGTGGAKLIEGLAAETDAAQLTIICNTADDCEFHGLHISPDIDTILYTLAGVSDGDKGWGIKDDTFTVLEQLRKLGDETWFNLGDKDLATHITRTRLLRQGRKLSDATDQIRRGFGVETIILPMSDERIETLIDTPQGQMSFQEFFVKQHWSPQVLGIRFHGTEASRPAPGVIEAIEGAAAIFICPSNPITSIGPILAVPKIHQALIATPAPVIAVSPLIGATAISGPAHKLMSASGLPASALGVAKYYGDFLDHFVIAHEDRPLVELIENLQIKVVKTNIRMTSHAEKRRLAREVLALSGK